MKKMLFVTFVLCTMWMSCKEKEEATIDVNRVEFIDLRNIVVDLYFSESITKEYPLAYRDSLLDAYQKIILQKYNYTIEEYQELRSKYADNSDKNLLFLEEVKKYVDSIIFLKNTN